MKTEQIQVPDGYKLQQVSEGKWELVKIYKDISDILKDDASYTPTCLFFKNGLDLEQMKQRVNHFIALSKLQTVADYLNEGWKWSDTDVQWCIEWYEPDDSLLVDRSYTNSTAGQVAFKSREIAQRAIEICGEQLIKEALGAI